MMLVALWQPTWTQPDNVSSSLYHKQAPPNNGLDGFLDGLRLGGLKVSRLLLEEGVESSLWYGVLVSSKHASRRGGTSHGQRTCAADNCISQ